MQPTLDLPSTPNTTQHISTPQAPKKGKKRKRSECLFPGKNQIDTVYERIMKVLYSALIILNEWEYMEDFVKFLS